MRRILSTLTLLLLATLVFLFPESAHAASDIVCEFVPDQEACLEADEATIGDLVAAVTNIISILVVAGSVIVIIIAGFTQVVSAGNPDTVKKSKNAIIFAVVGLVVVFFAQVIVRFVLGAV